MPDTVAYVEVPSSELLHALTDGTTFTFTSTADEVTIEGACPRCQHRFTQTLPLLPVTTAVGGITGQGADGLVTAQVDYLVACACSAPHPERPSAMLGCGAFAKIVLGGRRG